MDMDMGQIMGILNSPDGLKRMMEEDAFEDEDTGHTFSQADLIADVVNIQRMDTKRLAQALGVDMEISQMTSEHAATLLQGVAKGEDLGLIEVFDDIEDKHMELLSELEDEDEVEEYIEMKRSLLNTTADPEDDDHDN